MCRKIIFVDSSPFFLYIVLLFEHNDFAFHFLCFKRLLNLKSMGWRRWSLLIISHCFFKGQLHQHWKPWTWPARASSESAHIYSSSRKRSRFVSFYIYLKNIIHFWDFFHHRFKWNEWIDFHRFKRGWAWFLTMVSPKI